MESPPQPLESWLPTGFLGVDTLLACSAPEKHPCHVSSLAVDVLYVELRGYFIHEQYRQHDCIENIQVIELKVYWNDLLSFQDTQQFA